MTRRTMVDNCGGLDAERVVSGLTAKDLRGVRSEPLCRVPFCKWLLRFFGFEELAGLCEVEGVSVYDEFVVARVVRDLEDAFYLMTALAESFDEKIDIYHAG